MVKFRKIGVLTSGGDAPGMNAVVRAVARRAAELGMKNADFEVDFSQEEVFTAEGVDKVALLEHRAVAVHKIADSTLGKHIIQKNRRFHKFSLLFNIAKIIKN